MRPPRQRAAGAAAIPRAEERRVEILKAAGFNAIRSAHNPISKAALDACDRVGMLVMDETFDMWTEAKSPFDYSLAFPEWWEGDVEALVAKDFNHPSVVMYSIGNEIFETGRPIGSLWGRRLAEKIRSLDDTRFVTNGVNGLLAILDRLGDLMGGAADQGGDVNAMIASLGDVMQQIGASDEVTQATEQSHSVLDVAGLNYADPRYEPDREAFPNRIIVGTETFPGHIDELWRLVRENPHVIGDFTWTGWDYLGEAGIGRVDYPDEDYVATGISAPYPWLIAWCGDIDITGHRRPISYSDADEFELLLNGRAVGRSAIGAQKAFLVRFEVAYEPGELVAVAYAGGEERARSALRTAEGALWLTVAADRAAIRADDTDLAFVTITLQDDDGNLAGHRDRLVSVRVSGAGALAGLGSTDPRTEEPFAASACTTFDGRELAIERPTGPGDIEIRVDAEGCEPASATLSATEPRSGADGRS